MSSSSLPHITKYDWCQLYNSYVEAYIKVDDIMYKSSHFQKYIKWHNSKNKSFVANVIFDGNGNDISNTWTIYMP